MSLQIAASDRNGFLPINTHFTPEFESALAELLLGDEPFDDQISNELGKVGFQGSTPDDFSFGSDEVLKIGLGVNAALVSSLVLKRAPGEKLTMLDSYLPELDYGRDLVVALQMQAEAGLTAGANSSFGSYISLAGGTEVGGGAEYHRCKVYPRDLSARAIVSDFLTGLRWPLSGADSARSLPAGDIAAASFRGKLKLWDEMNLGYSVSGSKALSLAKLDAAFEYKLAAAIKWGGSFEMGGNFTVISMPGSSEDWVRLRVVRDQSRATQTHFGLDVNLDYQSSGIPDSSDGLLTALTGHDTRSILNWLELAAETDDIDAAVARVKEKVGEQASKSLEQLLGQAYRSINFDSLKAKIEDVLSQYGNFKDSIDGHLLDLGRKYIGSTDVCDWLKIALDKTTRKGLREISNHNVWKVIDELVGDRAYALLTDQDAFNHFRSAAQKLLDLLEGKGGFKPLKEFIEKVEERFDVDKLLDTLGDNLDKDKLNALAKGKLEGLLTSLFNLAGDALEGGEIDQTVAKLSDEAEKILNWKKKLDSKLKLGLKNQLELSLLYSTSSQRASSAVVDMEFNLARSGGRDLYELARRGDFQKAISEFDPAILTIHRGEFEESLEKSRSLAVHLFGWENLFEVKVGQVTEIETVMLDGGPVFLMDSESSLKMRNVSGFENAESIRSILQFKLQAQSDADKASEGVLVDLLNSLSCNYEIVRDQVSPDWDALPGAFRFAEQLGLVADAHAVVSELRAELGPNPPKSLSVKYSLSYHEEALKRLWNHEFLEASSGREIVSHTFRQALMDRWQFDHPRFFGQNNQDAYLSHHKIKRFKTTSPIKKHWRYVVEDAEGNKKVLNHSSDVLYKAYKAELAFLDALKEMDDAMDLIQNGGSDWKKLNRAIEAFLSVPEDEFSQRIWKGHLFMLVLDALLIEETADARNGRCAVQVDITPAQGDLIRRFYPQSLQS